MGFTASTTQAFQYSLPYEQVFNAATSALQAVKKATLTGASLSIFLCMGVRGRG